MKLVKSEKGFTMIEVIIAVFILTVALVGLAGLMGTTVRSTNLAKNVTNAANLAQERIEVVKANAALNFNNVVDAVAGSDPVAGTNPDTVEDYGSIAGYQSFRRETYITDTPAATVNSKDVAVRVVWRDVWGTHSTMLRTRLAR